MGSPPSGVAAIRMIAGLSLRRARRGRQLWLSVVLLVVAVVAAAASLAVGRGGLDLFDAVVDLTLRYVAPLLMLLHASSAVSEEVEARTITYLFSRPIPRWTVPAGKYLGAVTMGLALLGPGLILTYAITMLGERGLFVAELPHLVCSVVAAALAVLLFGAIATAFGTMVTGHSLVAAMFYVLIVEVGLAHVPGWLKVVAMTVHLRVVAGLYEPATTLHLRDPGLTLGISTPVILAEILLWLVVSFAWVGASEYRTDR